MKKLLMYVLSVNALVFSANLYVTPNPSAGADCSQTNPCSFQDALNTAGSNNSADTIFVEAGTYALSNTLTYIPPLTEAFDLTIKALDPNNKPRIVGNGSISLLEIDLTSISSNLKIEIDSLIFENGFSSSQSLFDASALKIRGNLNADIYIKNCDFVNNKFEFASSVVRIAGVGSVFVLGSRFLNNLNEFVNDLNNWRFNRGSVISIWSLTAYVADNYFDGNRAIDFSDGGNLSVGYVQEAYIVNNRIINSNNLSGIYVDANSAVYAYANHIENLNIVHPFGSCGCICVFSAIAYLHNNYCIKTVSSSWGSIYLSSGDYVEIINNISAFNETEYYGGGIGIEVGGPTEIFVVNNTIYSNISGVGGGGIAIINTSGQAPYVNIYNNIIYGNNAGTGNDLLVVGEGYINLHNNFFSEGSYFDSPVSGPIVIDPFNASFYSHAGNITGNPMFVDASSGNFSLQPVSPAIDAGNVSAPALPLQDFEGKSRIIGPSVDMGAVEYDPLNAPSVPDIVVSPPNITIDSIFVGMEKKIDVIISNVGDADLLIREIKVSDEYIKIDEGSECGVRSYTLQGGNSCILSFSIFPDKVGKFSGYIDIVSNDPDSPVYRINIFFNSSDWFDERSIKTKAGNLTFSINGGIFNKIERRRVPCRLPEGYDVSGYGALYLDVKLQNGKSFIKAKVNFERMSGNLSIFLCNENGKLTFLEDVNVEGKSIKFDMADKVDGKEDGRISLYIAFTESGIIVKRKGCYTYDGVFLILLLLSSFFIRTFRYNFNK